MEEMEEEEPPEIEEEIQGKPLAKKKKGPVENVIGELFELHTQQHLPSHSQKMENELDMYKAEPPPNQIYSDPLACCKALYSLICKLVQRMLSLVATSVSSKRLFSMTGNVIIDKCNRLTYELLTS